MPPREEDPGRIQDDMSTAGYGRYRCVPSASEMILLCVFEAIGGRLAEEPNRTEAEVASCWGSECLKGYWSDVL